MEVAEFESWLEREGLSGNAAAERLGVSAGAVSNYRRGARPIPGAVARVIYGEDVELPVVERGKPAVAAVEAAPEPVVISPEDLPPGSEGWRYRRGTTLPKGQFVERLVFPEHLENGAVVTAIRWCSNGVGLPSMQLIGSTKGVRRVPDHLDGYYPLAPGAYVAAKHDEMGEAGKDVKSKKVRGFNAHEPEE